MTNFDKLKDAGLADDNFNDDQIAEIDGLTEETVDAIIAAYNASGDDTTGQTSAGPS